MQETPTPRYDYFCVERNIYIYIYNPGTKLSPNHILQGGKRSPQIMGMLWALHLEVFPGTVEGTLQDGIEIVGWSVLKVWMKFQVSESCFFLGEVSHLHLGLEYLKSPIFGGFMIQFEHIFQMGWFTQPPTRINWYLATKLGLKYLSWLWLLKWNIFQTKKILCGPLWWGQELSLILCRFPVRRDESYIDLIGIGNPQCSDQDLTTTDLLFLYEVIWIPIFQDISFFFLVQICRKNGSCLKRYQLIGKKRFRFRGYPGIVWRWRFLWEKSCRFSNLWLLWECDSFISFPFAGYPHCQHQDHYKSFI